MAEPVAGHSDTAPKLAGWLEKNIPEGVTVFALPDHRHRRRPRTSNPMERRVQQEKRRTVKVRGFDPLDRILISSLPNDGSLGRLSAALVEIDDNWVADTRTHIESECPDA